MFSQMREIKIILIKREDVNSIVIWSCGDEAENI